MMALLRKLRSRVDGMVSRAVINRVNDALRTQRLQLTLLDGEVEDDVEHLQPYGMSFVPPANAEMLTLAVGGDRAHTVGICANDPGTRPTGGLAGTGGLYTATGWKVFIDASGVVHLGAETGAGGFLALASLVTTNMNTLKAAVTTAKGAVASGDGGLAALTALETALAAWPASMAATKAKAT